MRNENSGPVGWWRGLALACIATLGLAMVVGSGGCSVEGCLLGPCPGAFDNLPPTPTVEPSRITVQVGATVVFSVHTPGITTPTYQWSRAPRSGPPVAIPGATGATYTLVGANLGDDGAFYSATVRGDFNGTQVTVDSWFGHLTVSSMPAVLFRDSEFLPADWSVATISEPSSNGPTHTAEQVTSGGNPGAYREIGIAIPAGLSRLYLFHAFAAATYDPASQGSVFKIDYTHDCLALPGSLDVGPTLLIEQDGRRYIVGGPTQCGPSSWSNTALSSSTVGGADFLQVDGPGCVAGESCPNFSATGRPIRFGFANITIAGQVDFAGASGGFGIDNWQITVWRR